jgi:nucleoside-diphosphate-sugar epimerase
VKVLVTGAGGFIVTHLVERLRDDGHYVRVADLKYPEWSKSKANEFFILDLRTEANCHNACRDMDWVFNLAADMGGAGFVFTGQNDLQIMSNNTAINLNMLKAAHGNGVQRYFFSSSACIYPEYRQMAEDSEPLIEDFAYPALPDSQYGWEKLYTERLCMQYGLATEMETVIARFHNTFGPRGAWNNGREKLPAAACRKIAQAKLTGNHVVEIWGDGNQVRSYCYVGDCVEMILRLMRSGYSQPVNIGTDRGVTVNNVFDIVSEIAGIEVEKNHVEGPTGIKTRNADLSLMRKLLNYEPATFLEVGLEMTYRWIYNLAEKAHNQSFCPVSYARVQPKRNVQSGEWENS